MKGREALFDAGVAPAAAVCAHRERVGDRHPQRGKDRQVDPALPPRQRLPGTVESPCVFCYALFLRQQLAQLRMGLLQAGHYGVPQSRWRFFLLAGTITSSAPIQREPINPFDFDSPLAAHRPAMLPHFPLPTHAFTSNTCFSFQRARVEQKYLVYNGFNSVLPDITVRAAIGDLPPLYEETNLERRNEWGANHCVYHALPLHPFAAKLRMARNPSHGGDTEEEGDRGGQESYVHDHVIQVLRRGSVAYRRMQAAEKVAKHRNAMNEANGYSARSSRNSKKQPFKRLAWSAPFCTIVTVQTPGKLRCVHPAENRVCSVRETARAQGFPDYVHFAGKLANRYRQIGNGACASAGSL